MIKKLVVLVLVLAIAGVVAAGCSRLPQSAVASVNGKVITREDLDQRIEDLKGQFGGQGFPEPNTEEYKQVQKQIAQQLVTEQILLFEADKLGITASDDDVNQQLDQIKQGVGGEEKYQAALQQRNFTEDRLKDQIRSSLIFQKLFPEVTKDAQPVTDEQEQKYYQQNLTQFQRSESRHVRHILVADEATANAVKARLDAGEDFAAVAKQVSTDPGTKDKGGDLGDVNKEGQTSDGSSLVPEFVTAMNQLGSGQISGPVKTQYGYHIIQVLEVKPAGQQSFAEVKDQIKQALDMQNQRTAFEAWLANVKQNYDIQYSDEFNPNITTPNTASGPGTPQNRTQTQGQQQAPAPSPAP